MMTVAENHYDYQAATTPDGKLLSHSLIMIVCRSLSLMAISAAL